VLFENSAFRNKDKVLEALKKPADPQVMQLQQAQQQLAMAAAQAEVEKTQSETAENTVNAQAKMAGIQLDAIRAGMAG
jgi:hypothetical protein